jgi:S-adenosylmethionine:tRNA ribosyltransferase-isomerase
MHPKNISIADFTYNLPEEKIARYPLPDRDSSKLLVFHNEKIEENIYRNIDQYLSPGSLMIFNNTKVIEARIIFQKPTGASIEIFCLEPHEQYGDITAAMLQKETVVWLCLIGGASKWKRGQYLLKKIILPGGEGSIKAEYLEKLGDKFAIRISWTPAELSFAEILHYGGTVPLPPYLKREPELADRTRYQTVYAYAKGSVASPTAGLHFTEEIFKKLQAKRIATGYVTLHVGAGTFKPVKTERLEFHDMHAEWIDLDIASVRLIHEHADRQIVAVGTTSLRTIESLYWIGLKLYQDNQVDSRELIVKQWDPYDSVKNTITAPDALNLIIEWMENKKVSRLITKTEILIAPGYQMKIAKGLVTNFHQPNSTLLLLVAAFAGNKWKQIYDYALKNDFRFLSYGDGCLLLRD